MIFSENRSPLFGIMLWPRHHKARCLCPHSLHVYWTRVSPFAAVTRFFPPHFPHMASIRVAPSLMVMDFFSIASRIRRSVSSRRVCLDILRLSVRFGAAFSLGPPALGGDFLLPVPRTGANTFL